MRSIIDPPAYVVTVPTRAKYQYQQEKNVNGDWTKLLNRKHPNGRICVVDSDDDDLYTAVSVSPYHELFSSQIEDGIKDIVYAFINKNYMPISSCEGHDWSWDTTFVRLAVTSMQEADVLGAYFASIPFVTVHSYVQSANNEFYVENGVTKVRPLDPARYNAKSEATTINRLYFRNHSDYCFLNINLFEYKEEPFWSSIVQRYIMRYKKLKYLNSIKIQLLTAIENLPLYEK
jgi:hypothetical protein